jgi:hypothetical protein
MALLNADIPPQYCKVRKEYLYDFKKHHGESEDCVIFGLCSMAGAATLFHIMLPNGAVFFRLPISAFFQKDFDALDNGNYAIQPNNRILWNISNFTTRDDIPDYKVQTTEWNVENKGWITEDTDKMFYQIDDK